MSRCVAWLLLALPALGGAWVFVRSCLAQMARLHGEANCPAPYCDYVLFWVAGVLRAHGMGPAVYQYVRYQSLALGLLPAAHGFLPFEYPPMMLLPDMAIGRLPLAVGYYVFTVLSLAAVVALLRVARVRWWCIGLGLMSPAAMWEIYLGQFGLLCGAALLAGLSLLGRRPGVAGGLLGLLCVKPHYALLVPVCVLAARRWRAVVAGCVVVAVLAVVSGGGGVWAAYLGPGTAEIRAVMTAPFGAGASDGGTSVYWMLRSWSAGAEWALAGQCLVSVVVGVWVWSMWRRGRVRADVTVLATFLVSPYGYLDDLAVVSVIVLTCMRRGALWRNVGLAWLWFLPAYINKFTVTSGILVTPVLLAVACWWGAKGTPPDGGPTKIKSFFGSFFGKKRTA